VFKGVRRRFPTFLVSREDRARLGFRWLLAAALSLTFFSARAALEISAPNGMPVGNTISAEKLWEEFDHTLPAGIWVSPLESSNYEVISAKWMRQSFLPALQQEMKHLWKRGVPKENTAGNCSGFAIVARLMLTLSAMAAHAHTPAAATVIVKQQNPFGGLDATQEDHCVAYVLTDEGPWIVEVQSGAYSKIADYPNRETIKLVSVH
jgi:hypothetical protein